jgi:hypothetical protein
MRSSAAADPGTEYLERARAFVPELAAAAPEIERRRELPEPVVAAMVERGFFRMLLPRSLAGAELPPAPYVRVVEEIAKGDASAAWCLNQGAGCSMTAAYLDPAAAKEVFGGPRGILAWGPGPGKARIVEGGYRVTATWSFASGSHNATWLGCHVPIYDENGTRLLHPDGSPIIRTPIFPKPCAEMTDIWHVIGLRGTGSDKYSVTDLFVPEAFVAARDDSARRENGVLYHFSSLQLYASGFAGVAMGIARSTLDAFIELARDKVPWQDNPARQQCRPVRGSTGRGTLALRPRFIVPVAGGDYRRGRAIGPHHPQAADGNPARLDFRHPPVHERHRHDLSRRRIDRDLRREPVRAPLPRHPHRLAASAGPPGAFRDGRPVLPGPRP